MAKSAKEVKADKAKEKDKEYEEMGNSAISLIAGVIIVVCVLELVGVFK